MSYSIRVMYGEVQHIKKFGFYSLDKDADTRFDVAVKELNKLYHENGRFATTNEVVKHFNKYGFIQVAL